MSNVRIFISVHVYMYRYGAVMYATLCGVVPLRQRGGSTQLQLDAWGVARHACVYWLLCAIYLFATLGSVVASGGSGVVPAQLAASAPALMVGVPLATLVGWLLEGTVEAAVDAATRDAAIFSLNWTPSGGLMDVVMDTLWLKSRRRGSSITCPTTRGVQCV